MKRIRSTPSDQTLGLAGGHVTPKSRSVALDTFECAVKRYLRRQKALLSPGSYIRDERILAVTMAAFFGKGTKLSAIRQADVSRYIDTRSSVVSSESVKKEFYLLKRLFAFSVGWKFISKNPAQNVKMPPVPEGKLRYLQPWEVQSVLQSCPGWLRPIVRFALATGMRRGDILGLRWRDVHLETGRIVLKQNTASQMHILPINDLAQEALTSVRRKTSKPSEHVFVGKSITPQNVSQAFLRACKAANILDFSFNDLRYTAAKWMMLHGENVQTISHFLGHTDPRTTARYFQQLDSPHSLADAVKLIDSALAESESPSSQKHKNIPKAAPRNGTIIPAQTTSVSDKLLN
jgi:integrase